MLCRKRRQDSPMGHCGLGDVLVLFRFSDNNSRIVCESCAAGSESTDVFVSVACRSGTSLNSKRIVLHRAARQMNALVNCPLERREGRKAAATRDILRGERESPSCR